MRGGIDPVGGAPTGAPGGPPGAPPSFQPPTKHGRRPKHHASTKHKRAHPKGAHHAHVVGKHPHHAHHPKPKKAA